MEVRRTDLAQWGVGFLVLGTMPALLDRYYLIVLSQALVFAIAALGVNLLLGYTGLLTLGHAAYFGVGGYAGAFLFTFGNLGSLELHLGAGVVAATALATVFGFIATRSTRIYFTIMTLALAQVVHALFVGGAVFKPFGEVGKGFFFIGYGGLYMPRLTVMGRDFTPESFDVVLYYVVLASFVCSTAALWRVVRSPFGVALRAIRDSESRAEFLGLEVRRYRWAAFVISGAVVGLAGGLGAQLDRQVTPQQLNWLLGAELVVAAILGGTREFLGPVLGSLVIGTLKELSLRFPIARGLVLGSLLVILTLVLPQGLSGLTRTIARRVRGWYR